MTIIEELEQNLPEAQENVVLRDYTTMKVGGVADLFLIAKDIPTLSKALTEANRLQVPYFVLGNGSNVIISDNGFYGLVIKNETSNIVRIPDTSQLLVDSGTTLAKLISETASQELTGLELFSGIPGTVGGAVYGNAGVRGAELSDFIKELTLFHPAQTRGEELKIVRHQVDWMEYDHRSSKLKRDYINCPNLKPIILTVKIGLAPAKKADILERIRNSISLRSGGKDAQGVKHSPQPKGVLTSGCVFRNPSSELDKAAGYLLEKSGMKKKRIGDAYVSHEHANFIINRGKATAYEVRALIEEMRHKVKEKYNINLEEEVEYIGRW